MDAPRPSWRGQALAVLAKDVLIEARSGEVLLTTGFFAVLVVVMGSLSFWVGPANRHEVAAGVVWIAVTFAAALGFGRLWQREREDGALEGLLVAPLPRSALFAGKALGLTAFLVAVEAVVLPLSALLFSIDLAAAAPGLLAVALLATPGIAATGTLFGAMTATTRARDLLLSVLLFPLLSPVLLTAVVATRQLLAGAPAPELAGYLQLLAVFDVAFGAGALALFGAVLDG